MGIDRMGDARPGWTAKNPEHSMKKRTVIISAALVALLGAGAVVYAQGPRHFGHGRMHGHFGEDGMERGGGFDGIHGRFGRALSKDEFEARARERFARLDRNGDGVVDAAEIEAGMAARMEGFRGMRGDGAGAPGDRVIRMFDDNKDGKLSKEEHAANVRRLFGEMDLNNDGRISDEDLPPMLRGRNFLATLGDGPGMGRLGRGGMGLSMLRFFAGADQNKDGVITLEEAQTAGERRFATLDRNKDGVVDRADFDALRKEMADYGVKRFINHFGGDKDGRVTREQFMAKAQERFARMDFDNDGLLSRSDMPGGGRWHGWGRGGRGYGGEGPHGEGPGHHRMGPMGPGRDGSPGGPPAGAPRGEPPPRQ
jgi:Ca2+-binding EF-hand superfamily protein